MYWVVLFCVLSYRFVVSMKNLDFDWPLFGWGYGLAPLAYTVLPAMASSLYIGSWQDKKNLDCVVGLSNIVGV